MGEVLGGGEGVDRNDPELLLLLPGDVPNTGKAGTKNTHLIFGHNLYNWEKFKEFFKLSSFSWKRPYSSIRKKNILH